MVLLPMKKFFRYTIFIVIFLIIVYRMWLGPNPTISKFSLFHLDIVKLLDRAKIENIKRLLHVEKVCKEYNLGKYKTNSKPTAFKEPPTPHYEVYFYDRLHKLSWCPIFKAGSSTWLYNFAILGGFTDEEIASSKFQINEFVRKLYPAFSSEEAIAFLPQSLKFMIVRHPFERILSAYRDKLENFATRTKSGTPYFYKKYGRKIVSRYRVGGNNTNSRNILKKGQFIWNYDTEPVGIEPTFKEFVRYLIDTDLRMRADDHWIPFYLYCTPCSLTYNIIGKVETMMQDQLLIINSSELQNKLQPHWRHRTNPFDQSESNISEVAKMYFSQLNETDVKELYEKYKLDFLLFEYSESDYFQYVSR